MADTKDKEKAEAVPTEKKLDQLYTLIDGIEVAMMTTRTPDGSLVSRAMQMQARRPGTDLWFVTNIESGKVPELRADPHINLAFYRDRTREWVSVNGVVTIRQERALVKEFYKPDWKAWFGDEGGERDGGPGDPRIALLEVDARSVVYLKSDRPQVVKLFQVVASIVTGDPPRMGEHQTLSAAELARGEGRKG